MLHLLSLGYITAVDMANSASFIGLYECEGNVIKPSKFRLKPGDADRCSQSDPLPRDADPRLNETVA